MLTHAATITVSMLIALAAGGVLAEPAPIPTDRPPPAQPSEVPGSVRSAAELVVTDEAALGCHRETTASEPNPEPCDVFLKLTEDRSDESRRQAAAHNNRGLIMARLGGLEAALADFEAALALAPALSAAEVNRGTVLFRMGLYPDALKAFDNVIANDEAHRAAALFNRSFVYRALGELELAAADLASAAEIDQASASGRQPLPMPTGFTAEPSGQGEAIGDQSPE